MTSRSSTVCLALAVAAILCGGLDPMQVSGQSSNRPIEFSERNSSAITTNLIQLGAQRNGRKRLEDDLALKPARPLNSDNSLEGEMILPARPAQSMMPTKKSKELEERRKNWVFMNSEDLMGGPTAAELFHMPEYG